MSVLISHLKLKNFLSYGDSGVEIELEPLNVLIGPNGSGKSNLIESLRVLSTTPKDLGSPFREGGGVSEWLWKGASGRAKQPIAEVEAIVAYPQGEIPLRYRLNFTSVQHRLEIVDEAIENQRSFYPGQPDVYFFYRYQNGRPTFNVRMDPRERPGGEGGRQPRHLQSEDLVPGQSVLSQRKDPDIYPEITYIGTQFERIRCFTEWTFGRYTLPRMLQRIDTPMDFLAENGNNLGMVLNYLRIYPNVMKQIEDNLRKFYEPAESIETIVYSGGEVQVLLQERGLKELVPATRLSDGTLRFLCLLATLCHPTPPPLICIEEPELGLHPDILTALGKLLIEASQRTQLVVTTHSDTLVSALGEYPESVVVCERDEEGSRLRRLGRTEIAKWPEKYSLGELWLKGEIGGTRW